MNQIDQGVFSVAFNVPGLNGASGSGYLAKLDFQAAGHQGQSSSISISNLTIAGTQAEKIPASGIGDSISITIPVNNASPGNSGGGNSGGVSSPPTNKVVISGLNSTADVDLDASGRAISANILKTTDDKVRFEIGKNTLLLNSQGALLSNLSVSVLTSPPQPPPQNVILLAYEFGPQGAVFNPPLNLTLTFNPDTFAQPLDETMLRLAYWSGSDWVTLESQIDITTGTIHAQISHFSQYALLGRVIPKTTELAETTPLIPSTVPAFSPSRTETLAPTSQVVGVAEIPSGEVVENRKVEPPPVAETTPLQTPAAKSNSPLTWLIIGGLLIIITALGILLIRKNKP
jgi:hypothetical protein